MSHRTLFIQRGLRRFLGSASAALVCAGLSAAWAVAGPPQAGTSGAGTSTGTTPDVGAAGASLAPAPPSEITLMRLRDGGVRFGAIVGHDAQDLHFSLLATGGVVQVPWSMLDPTQAQELLTRYGYIETVAEEIFVEGERLVLTAGGTVEGIILSRDNGVFLVKTGGNLQALPQTQVAAIEKGVRIPALDVYSVDELYNQYAAQASPDDPAAQWQLAETCEHLYTFGRAVEHYQKVRELDPTYRADELANILPRVQLKAQQQVQLDYLREADRMRKRGQWDAALDSLKAFPTLYPESLLVQDARLQEARLLNARAEAAKDYVPKRWYHWMRKLTRELAREDSFAAARAHVDERLSEEIQKAVLGDVQNRIAMDAELERIKETFAARKKVRYDSATYGTATWLIGLEAAQRGAQPEDGEGAAPVNETDNARAELEKRIKQFLKNQRVASRGKQAEQKEDEEQNHWASMSSEKRALWLLAYYAENSGDLEMRARPDLKACSTCGGKGAIEILLTGGGGSPDQGNSRSGRGGGKSGGGAATVQLQECPLCHGVQVVRRVYFR